MGHDTFHKFQVLSVTPKATIRQFPSHPDLQQCNARIHKPSFITAAQTPQEDKANGNGCMTALRCLEPAKKVAQTVIEAAPRLSCTAMISCNTQP